MRLIGIFIALVLGFAAALGVLKMTEKNQEEKVRVVTVTKPSAAPVTPTVKVLTARQEIPIGSIIKPEMLDPQPWPANLVLPDFVQQDDKGNTDIIGMVARTPFQMREPIIRSKLANPKDPSFIAAWLPQGKRAVTIGSDGIGGVAGFVFPGDRVDVLLVHFVPTGMEINAEGVKKEKAEQVTEVLLSNIKVLAVNQKSTSAGAEGPIIPNSITLEVSQSEAQKLRLAEKNGMLSLAMRSIKDKDDITLTRPTGMNDLSRLTRPSYYPKLYDYNSNYTPKIVTLTGKDFEPKSEEAKAAGAGKEEEEIELPDDVAKSVSLVRGVKKEIVGVDRP